MVVKRFTRIEGASGYFADPHRDPLNSRTLVASHLCCWWQHSPEGDLDNLCGKGEPCHTDEIAGALSPIGAVGLLADLAGDSECRIDIEHIERFFHHMVEGRDRKSTRLNSSH